MHPTMPPVPRAVMGTARVRATVVMLEPSLGTTPTILGAGAVRT